MALSFPYGETELAYLSRRDPKLGAVIAHLGKLEKFCYSDLFQGLVQIILGQQISAKAQAAIWGRLNASLPVISPENILNTDIEVFRAAGVSARKMHYIQGIAEKIQTKEVSLEEIRQMSDQDAITALCRFKGIGEWTAKILLVMALKRQNIFNEQDLSVQRGLRMLHGHRAITPHLLTKYRRLYSPYNSVAMFYLYAISEGKVPEIINRSW